MPGSEQAPREPQERGAIAGHDPRARDVALGATGRPGRVPLPLVGRRCLQFALDTGLLALWCCLPLALLLSLPENPDGSVGSLLVATVLMGVVLVACVILSAVYWVAVPARRDGRTYAMGWLGLRVVADDGGAASSGQLLLRWVLLLVDACLFGLVGLVSMLLTARRLRLGDLVAGTEVIRTG